MALIDERPRRGEVEVAQGCIWVMQLFSDSGRAALGGFGRVRVFAVTAKSIE